ncbi:MAG: hypothetical protein HYS38_02205 [Acidobacteria bacterium]|nr:hypothetical protein [Acidobacteriota bacterium]
MPKIKLHDKPEKAKKGGQPQRMKNPTTAFRGEAGGWVSLAAIRFAGIGDLRVVICPDGDFWFAQGLEIDYAAQGKSPKDAKKQFSDGLSATVEQHLQIYGNIEKLLKAAPPEVWKDTLLSAGAIAKRYSAVMLYHVERQAVPDSIQGVFPFQGINYLELRKSA